MKNELFELCKQVYEANLWDEPLEFDYAFTPLDNGQVVVVPTSLIGRDGEYLAPIYDSDYLLEKLPIGTHVEKLLHGYGARIFNPSDLSEHTGVSDTPLKALLILTLSLVEAGILKREGGEVAA